MLARNIVQITNQEIGDNLMTEERITLPKMTDDRRFYRFLFIQALLNRARRAAMNYCHSYSF